MIVKTPVFPGSSHRPTVVTSLMELPTAAACKAASSCCDFAYLMWRQGVICRRELPTSGRRSMASGLKWILFRCRPRDARDNPERRVFFLDLHSSEPVMDQGLRGLGFATTVQISSNGRYVAVITGTREPRADWLLDRQDNRPWRQFLNVPALCYGFFAGENYIAHTIDQSANGRIVSIPIGCAGDQGSWSELVGEEDGVIRGLAQNGENLVVLDLVDAQARLRIFTLDGIFKTEDTAPRPRSGIDHGCFQLVSGARKAFYLRRSEWVCLCL